MEISSNRLSAIKKVNITFQTTTLTPFYHKVAVKIIYFQTAGLCVDLFLFHLYAADSNKNIRKCSFCPLGGSWAK